MKTQDLSFQQALEFFQKNECISRKFWHEADYLKNDARRNGEIILSMEDVLSNDWYVLDSVSLNHRYLDD